MEFLSENTVYKLTARRKGETKLGEKVLLYSREDAKRIKEWKKNGARFGIIGIPECIGVLGNNGKPGAQFGFEAFLSSFLNVQSNSFLTGKEFIFYGQVDVKKLQERAEQLDEANEYYLQNLHVLCDELDGVVEDAIIQILKDGLIPIVIGGGHNNAYPLLKATSEFWKEKKGLNCINMDAHADFRALEGRHSGNGFSYAKQNGFLNKYAVFGLHENYNGDNMLKTMGGDETIHYQFLEQITYLDKRLVESIAFVHHEEVASGVELDMDAIRMMPSSAISPSGFSLEQARHYVRKCAEGLKVAYLHLPEGAPITAQEQVLVGKAFTYLVTDFAKAYLNKKTTA